MAELIATGGTGNVYSISDTVVRKAFSLDACKKEYDILSRLNIATPRYFPQVFDYNLKDRYIDMSYCGTQINENNIPSGWMDQIIKIAKILDRCGVLHFDIKPENLLVYNGEIKLIDFEKSVLEKLFLCPEDATDHYNYENECIYLDDKVKYYDVIWAKNNNREHIPYGGVKVMQQLHKKKYDNLSKLRKSCLEVLNNAAV